MKIKKGVIITGALYFLIIIGMALAIIIIADKEKSNYSVEYAMEFIGEDNMDMDSVNIDGIVDNKEGMEVGNGVNMFFVDNQEFIVGFEQSNDTASIKEYVLAGETVQKYSHLFAIRTDSSVSDGYKAYVDKVDEGLQELGHITVRRQDGENSAILYFSVLDPQGNFVEHNIFKYLDRDIVDGGIVSYQFVQRDYFKKTLPENRVDQAQIMFEYLNGAIEAISGTTDRYISKLFNFSLVFPNAWKDKIVAITENKDLFGGVVSFGFAEQPDLLRIEIIDTEGWLKLKKNFDNEDLPGDLPEVIAMTDENVYYWNQYVFETMSDEMTERLRERSSIIKTFKLIQ